MKTIYKITVMLLLISAYSAAQTGVTITYYDGTAQGFNVTSGGKLYFGSDQLYVKTDGTTAPTTIPVNIIRKITFGSVLATTTFGENRNHLALYPNPGSDYIRIQSDADENLNTKIYSMAGQLVQQGTYQPDQDIDVSGLASGLYLVQVDGLTIKFSKK
jgi:hypothetical protein